MRETLVKTEEFKDSPVGRIPKDWDVSSLAALTQYITYGFTNPMPTTKDGPWMITAFDIANGKICYGQARHTSEKAYKNDLTQKSKPNLGDILITKDGTLGRIAVVDRTGICINQSVACLRPLLDTDVRFLVHYLRSDIGQERMLADAGGSTIKHIYITKLAQMEVPVPPREERTRISDILDTIDSTIAHTSSLIAKLKQMKAGLLHDLLTRGLDENGELRDAIGHPEQFKDSPLGQIPKDWEIRTCESVCREIVVGIVIKPSQYYQSSGVPALRSANVREAGLNPSDLVFISERSNRLLAKSMIRRGDVLTVRTGYPGTSCVVPPEFNGANCVDIIISRPGAEIESAFLATWINSDFGKDQVLRVQGGLAQQHFNVGELQKLLIAKPSIEEQRVIQTRIEAYDTRIRTEEAYRDKLKLQKQGLMHDLLTGKLRIKDADKFTSASDTV